MMRTTASGQLGKLAFSNFMRAATYTEHLALTGHTHATRDSYHGHATVDIYQFIHKHVQGFI